MYYVLYVLSGAIVAGGLPYFLKGIMGEKHALPFGFPSTAVANVLWGVVSFVLGWALWHYAGVHRNDSHIFRYEVAWGLGALVACVALAYGLANSSMRKSAK